MARERKMQRKGAKAARGRGSATASASPPKRVEGVGLPSVPKRNVDKRVQAQANSPDALRGWLSGGAGPMLTRTSTYPATALNPAKIYDILIELDRGITYRFADMSQQVLQRDAHLAGVDRARRVEVAGKPFRLHAANETDLAVAIRDFLEAAIDGLDSFDHSAYELLGCNAPGWSSSEIVWAWGKVRFPGPNKSTITIEGLFPRELMWVHPKHFTFDYVTDEVLLDLGTGGAMPLPPHKFIFHGAAGDGFYEHRGYMRQAVWLHMLKHNSIRDWAVFIALYGIPGIYGLLPKNQFENPEFKAIMRLALQDYGQGKPAILPDDMQIDSKPGPIGSGAAEVHARMVGFCNTEMSKLVQSETLTTEMSGTGSYNASETHAAVKHAVTVMDGSVLAADTRRDLLRSILALNADALGRALGATPEQLQQACSRCSWRIEREVTPVQRMQMFDLGVNRLGLDIDEEQVRTEFAFDRPRRGSRPLRGAPVTVSSGGMSVGSNDAVDGVEAPAPGQQ